MSELKTREREKIVIIDLAGSLDGHPASLHGAIKQALVEGRRGVVLNLEAATYLNSAWLGGIVQNFLALSRVGGRLNLLNVPPDLMNLLVVSKLSAVFDVFTSEDDAVNSFFPSRPLRYPYIKREDTDTTEAPKPAAAPLLVFMCHSSGDKPTVRDLRKRLIDAGARPWLDEVDLLPGQVWEREIAAAVRRSDAVLVCLSAATGKAGYLQREIKQALDVAEEQSDDSIFLIPGRLEPCEVPERLRRWQWVDLFVADGYDRLLTALQARALALGRVPIRLA